MRHVATIESIGSSTRIQGAKLTDQQIETLLANLQRHTFKSRDEQEVAGYGEAMDLLFQSWEELTLTENHLKQLHAVLLKFSAKDEYHRGQYKRAPNHVVAYDRDGKEIGVIFETTSPFQTPMEMQQLVEWTNQAFAEKLLHPLLILAVFVVRFLAIHPFQDGNGRLCASCGDAIAAARRIRLYAFLPLESVIEEENEDSITRRCAKPRARSNRRNPTGKRGSSLLHCLKKQKDNLDAKLQRERILAQALPQLSLFDDSEIAQGTRAVDDFGVGTADRSEPKHDQGAAAGIGACGTD